MHRELPPAGDYLAGSIRAAANARQLCRAARCLERAHLFGPAITLLATALEESAKAGALVWLTEEDAGVEHAKLVEKIFRDHGTKYRLAAWAMGSGTEPPDRNPAHAPAEDAGLGLIGLVAILLLGLVLQHRELGAQEESAIGPAAPVNAESLLDNLLDADPESPHPWISKAFDLRNAGLYVAYGDGAWHSPSDLGALEVREARAAVVPLVRGASSWARRGSSN